MRKWILLILTALVMISLVNALEICEFNMNPSDVPCMIISTWNYEDCNSTEIFIYDSTPELVEQKNYTNYAVSLGRCNATWNITTKGTYIWNNSANSDTGTIVLESKEDSMASLAIMLLVMGITVAVFMIGYRSQFTQNQVSNFMIKRSCYLAGIWLLVLDLLIATTIADTYGLGVNKEMFRFLWFAHKTALVFTMVLLWATARGALSLWKIQKSNKRMGYD